MKKKIDAITVISILFIILTWAGVFMSGMNTGACEVDDFGMSLKSLEQLFGGAVYAMAITPNRSLNTSIRNYIRNYTNDSLYVVCFFNCLSNNKIHSIKI